MLYSAFVGMNPLYAVIVLGISHLLSYWFLKLCEICTNIPPPQINKAEISLKPQYCYEETIQCYQYFFLWARRVKNEFEKADLHAMVILNYAHITNYQFPIITKYEAQFLKSHLKYAAHVFHNTLGRV